jgi:hypothetical protein
MIGDWRISLAFVLVGLCVATLQIRRFHRESQDRALWLQDMAERRTERAERQQERAERRQERAARQQGRRMYSPEEYKEEASLY